MSQGILHLIPNILAENGHYAIPEYLKEIVSEIKHWYCEEIRSARRFLKAMNKEIVIDDLQFYMLNEHENGSLQFAADLFRKGLTVGMISEAGCPAVADPGNELVRIAHQQGAIVKPHTGPNAILLALMGSGFNGQHFEFHGYLPNKQPFLNQKILELEKDSKLRNVSHFFIEVPYRNDQLIQTIIKKCQDQTSLCIAVELTGKEEQIVSKTIAQWKKSEASFHKKAAVFGIYVSQQ
jgi:16S rRNA (cytidine1402-2'-O)-methyltransferase